MLLVMEVRLVMKKATKDCVAKELINKWAKLALKRGAFAQTILPNKTLTTDQTEFPSSSNNQNNNIQSQMDPLLLRCFCCDQRIIKSFYLFSCGHVMHLECIDEFERKCLCGRERDIDNEREDINKNYYENGESSDSSSDSTPPLERLRRRKVKEAAALASSIPTITNEERQSVSAVFKELELAFPLNPGPRPSSCHLFKQQSQNLQKHGSTSSFAPT
uniref:Uncharacterized protein n=1 Tax=Meloidogyne enterolobii TaxID=390850 RepID=A0A6V7XXN6_MELEN|nr:unnamed protein product [Meloidogyne enterolobii]